MHKSAMNVGGRFFSTYLSQMPNPLVMDIGAQDVRGSLKSVLPAHARYLGVDMVAGKGVDVVIDDPYKLPFDDASADVVVSSSCFEHAEFFWLSFLEIMRVLKPNGLVYLNVPSNGAFHRYPVDCWRFYPDSGRALANWARKNQFDAVLLESFVLDQCEPDRWNDFVCVILRSEAHLSEHTQRMMDSLTHYANGLCHPHYEQFRNLNGQPEEQRRFDALVASSLRGRLSGLVERIRARVS